jgi:GNAT superfamily N-acetyltransferase
MHLGWQACIRRHLRSLTRPGARQRLIVAEVDGAVVGLVHYRVDAGEQSGSIGVSAVHPAHRGRGVALKMYLHVLELMRARGVKYVTAETEGHSARDPLRRAYEKAGFVALPIVRYVADLGIPSRIRAGGTPRRQRTAGQTRPSLLGGRGRSHWNSRERRLAPDLNS